MDTTALLVKGIINEADGNLPLAISFYEEIIRLHPKHTDAIKRKAAAEMDLHMDAQALSDINQSIALDRFDSESFVIRGMLHFYTFNKKMEAIIDYNRALCLDPGNVRALFHRGYAYLKYGNKDYARDDFSKADRLGCKEAGDMLEQYFP